MRRRGPTEPVGALVAEGDERLAPRLHFRATPELIWRPTWLGAWGVTGHLCVGEFQFCKSLAGCLLTRTLAPGLLVSIVLMKTPPRYYTRGGF